MSESIAALEKVKIGGMDQWIQIRGNAVSNPVLLWLHGGPGAAQMPIAHYYNGELEETFIVVHWDQRGAGKSNPPDFDEKTMNFAQYVEDTHELTQYLKKRFNRMKIYLIGHSWGSQLGIKVVQAFPEDYYAYVGVSQVVNNLASNKITYKWLLEKIEKSNNKSDYELLEKLGQPPFTNHEKYVRFVQIVDSYGGSFDVGMDKLFWISLCATEYSLSDYIAWLKGSARGSGVMWDEIKSINLRKEIPQLNLPVYFFSGKNDYNTPLQLVEEYYRMLNAPKGKELVIFEESSHTPFLKEKEKFFREMIRVKEETIKSDNYKQL